MNLQSNTFTSSKQNFTSGTSMTDNMILNLQDAHWKHVRNEMTPTFTSGKLKQVNYSASYINKID